ncbi:SWI/SNF-related matrix-associated actin-dependent regulator of chromatin subfamily A-like protein 1 [Schistocerca gregaria]|uniref:SWI/SNF-related matrix-associated actin-dependent regulator of chromatin subfamily A-like protein 1 n=1 Tax=Schistocerca gregaria TaxID=7010 RepID=UPI00211ED4FB|nr:SWI/SNF-related matrix-associated actin-dependent regulator of chromatin subfamily A-like protein 1 [Schistocerca gregaria]
MWKKPWFQKWRAQKAKKSTNDDTNLSESRSRPSSTYKGLDFYADQDNPKSPLGDFQKSKTVSLQILNKERFVIHSNIENLKKIFKEFENDTLYDPTSKLRSFELRHRKTLIERLEAQGYFVQDIPSEVLDTLQNVRHQPNSKKCVSLTKIPEEIRDALLPFQVRGVCFTIHNQGRALICDEMGLGKTIQAIAVAMYYLEEWPLLVIAPSSLKNQWASEFERWIPKLQLHINVVSTAKHWRLSKINIISYDLAKALYQEIREAQFKIIICDESHYLKSVNASRTKMLVPILQATRRLIMLTGTPALSRPCELYPQLVALNCSIFPSYHSFGLRYCGAYQTPQGWDYSGSSNLHELHTILRETIMIRRLKADVMTELPQKIRKIVNIDVGKDQIEKLKPLLSNMSARTIRTIRKDNADDSGHNILAQVYKQTAKAKKHAVIQYLTTLINAFSCNSDLVPINQKFLVFAHHVHMMDAIEELLQDKKVPYIRIDGSTPIKERSSRVDRFNLEKGPFVAILSLTCAGTGINMTSASLVLFSELHWTPGTLVQAEDRVHRIGQKASFVEIRYLLAKNTLDDVIWTLISKKLGVVGSALNGVRDYLEITPTQHGSLSRTISYSANAATNSKTDAKRKNTNIKNSVQGLSLNLLDMFEKMKKNSNPPSDADHDIEVISSDCEDNSSSAPTSSHNHLLAIESYSFSDQFNSLCSPTQRQTQVRNQTSPPRCNKTELESPELPSSSSRHSDSTESESIVVLSDTDDNTIIALNRTTSHCSLEEEPVPKRTKLESCTLQPSRCDMNVFCDKGEKIENDMNTDSEWSIDEECFNTPPSQQLNPIEPKTWPTFHVSQFRIPTHNLEVPSFKPNSGPLKS